MADLFGQRNALPPVGHSYNPTHRPGSSALTTRPISRGSQNSTTDLFTTSSTQPLYTDTGEMTNSLNGSTNDLQYGSRPVTARSRPVSARSFKLEDIGLSRSNSFLEPKASPLGKKLLTGLIVVIVAAAVATGIALAVVIITGESLELHHRYRNEKKNESGYVLQTSIFKNNFTSHTVTYLSL